MVITDHVVAVILIGDVLRQITILQITHLG